MTDYHVIIPARYHSSRLPQKCLLDLGGISVLEHVYRQAVKASPTSITIATDHQAIFDLASSFGAPVKMTLETHQSGTARLGEIVESTVFKSDDIIVNLQGDEPFMPVELIQQVADGLSKSTAPVATLCSPLKDHAELNNPNIVKVVRNHENQALYFSRSPIPLCRDNPDTFTLAYRHIGLYAYRVGFLREMVSWPVCALEAYEALEQLRILWSGYAIQVDDALVLPRQDINTADDYEQAKQCVMSSAIPGQLSDP